MEHVSDEPFPGWLKVEVEGQKPFYKTPFPRTIIRSGAMLKEYIAREQLAGRMDGSIEIDKFSFKRKYGLKTKVAALPCLVDHSEKVPDTRKESIGEDKSSRTVVELLTRDPDKIIEHKRLLSNMSKQVDEFHDRDAYQNPSNFDEIKEKISNAADIKDIFAILIDNKESAQGHTALFSDVCLAEISQINVKNCPLVEFPSSINENIFCEIVNFGMAACPHLLSFVVNMVVRKENPVLPSDIMKIATLFSSICCSVNHNLDALVRTRSMTLQLDGLSNQGLDTLSDVGLTQCSRSLSNHRDLFADVGRDVMENTAAKFPYQSIIGKIQIDLVSIQICLELL